VQKIVLNLDNYFGLLSVPSLKVKYVNIFIVAFFSGRSFDQISLYNTTAQPVARGQNFAGGGGT